MIGLHNKCCTIIVICCTTHSSLFCIVNIDIAFIRYVQILTVYLVNLRKALGGDSIYLLLSSSLVHIHTTYNYINLNKTRAKWPWHPGIGHGQMPKPSPRSNPCDKVQTVCQIHTKISVPLCIFNVICV